MDSSMTLTSCLLLLLAATISTSAIDLRASHKVVLKSDFEAQVSAKNPGNRGLNTTRLPQNIAHFTGETVILPCSANSSSTSPRIHWIEYVYNLGGGMISDGNFILPGHPQRLRYAIRNDEANQFDLVITGATMADGGTYECYDSSTADVGGGGQQNFMAQLIVLGLNQNCSSIIPGSGLVVEGFYYTVECYAEFGGNIIPYLEWVGPEPFSQAYTSSPTRVWNGMSFSARRTMTGQYWTSTLNFTRNFFVPEDHANNIPSYKQEYQTTRIQVQWTPQNLYISGVKEFNIYYPGDQLECFADAFPTPSYEWHNLRTNQRYPNSVLTIPGDWVDEVQTMRCQAVNYIGGLPYSNDISLPVNVIPLPTTPPTTTPTTTTPPPAVAPCRDFTGRWESTKPSDGLMCIEVDSTTGSIHGVLRNATDTFWIDLVGRTDVSTNDHITFTGIWPQNRAVSGFVGECYRCHGEEHMLVSVISRTKGGPPCATAGVLQYSQEFEFRRNSAIPCPPISYPPTFMK
jgi:hypothetical protein